jgi:hypothetical protein
LTGVPAAVRFNRKSPPQGLYIYKLPEGFFRGEYRRWSFCTPVGKAGLRKLMRFFLDEMFLFLHLTNLSACNQSIIPREEGDFRIVAFPAPVQHDGIFGIFLPSAAFPGERTGPGH